MKSLKQIIKDSGENRVAIGHFNVAEVSMLKAIFEAAKELGAPVIIGTSEGEAGFLGRKQAAALVQSWRKEYRFPIFLNSDHTHSFAEVKQAVAAGYDAILFDGARLPFGENIRRTKEVVKYAKSKNKNILVEGELGNIGSGSVVRKELPKGLALSLSEGAATIRSEDLTKPEEAARFVKETGVDFLAPAVGNIHGMMADVLEPALNIERIKAIKKVLRQVRGKSVPLVLHGGSGNTDADFLAAIDAGVNIIHISTELRVAWRKGLEKGLRENHEEIAPYKILAPAVAEVKKVVYNRLKLFSKS